MKRISVRLSLCIVAVLVTMAAAFLLSSVYADSYDVQVDEGVDTTVRWGTEYDSDAVTYYELKPSKTGLLVFTASYTGYTALCDANGKVISLGTYSGGDFLSGTSSIAYQKIVSYGVKKGKTYYLMMTGMPYERNEEGKYFAHVLWQNQKIKAGKYGAKKSKAKTIKKGKTVKGLFVAGNKKGQWFKITNKQKTTKITFTTPGTNDSLKVMVYYKSYNKWYNSTYYVYRSNKKNVLTGTVSRKIKHTYYLKVFPNGKSSGAYTLKWK